MKKPSGISTSLVLLAAALAGSSLAHARQQAPAGKPKQPPVVRGLVPNQLKPVGGRLRLASGIPIEAPLDLKAVRTAAVPSEILDLVAELASDGFQDRIDAMLALRSHPAPDVCLMSVLDANDGLLEEQRLRLLSAIEWRILNRPRGAVGIRMMPFDVGIQPAGIEVQEVIAGLPAERVLRVGDVLIQLDDRPVIQNQDLILHVQQMRPGEKISVDLLRPVVLPQNDQVPAHFVEGEQGRLFEPIKVELTLGSYEQLGDDRGVQNAETSRRQIYVDQVRACWGDSPGRQIVRSPVPDAIRPATQQPYRR